MLFSPLLDRFAKRAPISVMVRAALLGFGIARVSCNLLSVTRRVRRAVFGAEHAREEVTP